MAQVWILLRDVAPTTAAHTGQDASVCGACPLRGTLQREPLQGSEYDMRTRNVGRTCYVTLFQAPQGVWRAYKRGAYPRATPEQMRQLTSSLPVRLGAYGDPGALPLDVVRSLIAGRTHTGYTHQWRDRPDLAPYVMASVDAPAQRARATAMGWRTFRTRSATDPLLPGEIPCPASDEAGKRTTCDRCALCSGGALAGAKDIAIIVHGRAAAARKRRA